MTLYDPGIRLDQVIDEAINAFAANRRAYWREEEEDGLRNLQLADYLAKVLLEPSADLTSPRGPGQWDIIREIAEDIKKTDPAYEGLELEIVERFLPSVQDMADRCLDLIRLPIHHEPNKTVRQFLTRVARC